LSQYNCDGSDNLSLKDIDIGEDLLEFLADCVAEKLVIDGCPGFGDGVLNEMMTPDSAKDPFDLRTTCCCAPYVNDLSILNCRGFSISALKQMIETRLIQSRKDPIDVDIPPAPHIKILRLSGRVPDVSLEDREWFDGHLSEISYDLIQ
jgi:hypothetical protein